MPRRVAVILQPGFLPWLGFFAQMHRSDVFVVYDDVQYDKGSWRNRNRIKTSQGVQWLTVPVLTRGQDWPTNREIKINNSIDWRRKHLLSISQNYQRAPYFRKYIALFEDMYTRDWNYLIDLNMFSLSTLCNAIGLEREIHLSSELKSSGKSVDRLISICKEIGANRFYEGAAGRNYIDEGRLAHEGIELIYQDYAHPVYPQLHGDFVPYLSIVDLLFNCGPKSLEVLSQ